MTDPSQYSEAETCYNVIAPLLRNVDWNLADRSEIAFRVLGDGCDATPENGPADHTLYRYNGEMLSALMRRRKLSMERFYETPFMNFRMGAVKQLFKAEEVVEEIIEMPKK